MLKTLATCKPSEFLIQTNRIKRSAERWFRETGIMEIRHNRPILEDIPETASSEVREEITKRNEEVIRRQGLENFSKMLDAILEEHPQETLELLALCCFVEPEDVDKHPMSDYLTAFTSLLNDKAVVGFFTSLVMLGQRTTLKASKA